MDVEGTADPAYNYWRLGRLFEEKKKGAKRRETTIDMRTMRGATRERDEVEIDAMRWRPGRHAVRCVNSQ